MRYFHMAILLTACVLLCSINHMNIVWQQQGEQASDDYGYNIIALDFNGDDIDDLAVNAQRYRINEDHHLHKGKLYIYYGSDEGLPDTPNVTASVQVDTSYINMISWEKIQNLGDMNGDGCDDIGYSYHLVTYDGEYHESVYANILLGNTVNDTIPDYSFISASHNCKIHPLGDINGDGYDDAGIIEGADTFCLYILYGGSFEKVPFVSNIYTTGQKSFRGLGDVNGDGYDDFSYYYRGEYDGERRHHYNQFFYGGAIQDTIPDYSMDWATVAIQLYELAPAGDWNGDGYDDFVLSGYDVDEETMTALGCPLWRGGETIHWDRYGCIEYYSTFIPSFGDLNNDGMSDIVSPYHINNSGGIIYFYLGCQNGTWDYEHGNSADGFGVSEAVGDFDNDGYDDIAVGAYGTGETYPSNWGYVYVYGGHQNLEETDLDPVDNETVPSADITFNAYPNPFNPEISFEIKTDKSYNDLKIEIYNAKGQKVETLLTPLRRGNKGGVSITWNAGDFASGIYFCKLNAGDNTLQTRKVTLMK